MLLTQMLPHDPSDHTAQLRENGLFARLRVLVQVQTAHTSLIPNIHSAFSPEDHITLFIGKQLMDKGL